jgi:enterochelin esterase-like enzyme
VLFESNQVFEQRLKTNGFSYQYDVFTGEHSWEYWNEHIQQTFEFFSEIEQSSVLKLK